MYRYIKSARKPTPPDLRMFTGDFFGPGPQWTMYAEKGRYRYEIEETLNDTYTWVVRNAKGYEILKQSEEEYDTAEEAYEAMAGAM